MGKNTERTNAHQDVTAETLTASRLKDLSVSEVTAVPHGRLVGYILCRYLVSQKRSTGSET